MYICVGDYSDAREVNSREVLYGILWWLFEKALKLITGPLNRGQYWQKDVPLIH